MLGAIIGDIVGSVYEWDNIKIKDFSLFREDCFFTDDTVMTIAIADAILNGATEDDFIDSMKKFGRMYPNSGYGVRFADWIRSDTRKPYNSWGNGSAMRVSPCAIIAYESYYAGGSPGATIDHARQLAIRSASVTHNHPEGIKGAEATAHVMMLVHGYGLDSAKKHIKEEISELYGYDLSRTLDEIRPVYEFNESCQETVPEAIIAFLESTDFEDAIRNAISLGGDSDTLAAITGGIAEAAYGVPDDLTKKALSYLDAPLLGVYNRWCRHLKEIEKFT